MIYLVLVETIRRLWDAMEWRMTPAIFVRRASRAVGAVIAAELTRMKLAFLGLGVMGFPMAGHLVTRGGHDLTVYNRTAAKAQAWLGALPGPFRADAGRGGARVPKSSSLASATTTTCAP